MANAVKCPKCENVEALRAAALSTVLCSRCGATVETSARKASEPRILWLSMLVLFVGLATLGVARRARRPEHPREDPATIYTAPPQATSVPTPAGVISWEPSSRSPVPVAINQDGIEDFVGFFRVWDGASAWISHVGAFDGASLRPLWRSEPLTPRIVKSLGIVPFAVVVRRSVVVGDASSTLRVFEIETGEKVSTLSLPGPVMDACAASGRVWVKVAGGPDLSVDIVTGTSDPASRPKSCPVPEYQRGLEEALPKPGRSRAVDASIERNSCPSAFMNRVVARAACRPPSLSHDGAFAPMYDLDDGAIRISIGKRGEIPVARGSAWERSMMADASTPKTAVPVVSDLVDGRFIAVAEREHAEAHLTVLDALTGDRRWDIALPQSEPGAARGPAEALVATPTRVYVVRAGGSLDIYDASTGTSVGSIGTQ